ncbi:MAG: hypothetical protein ACRC2H_08420 [Silanimonas sp.]
MPLSLTPLLRTALHLVLALSVALQASAVAAMHAGAAAAAEHALDAKGATARDLALDSHDARPDDVPPCHAAVADADGTLAKEAADPAAGCCGDSPLGELCRWACAQAMSVGVLPLVVATRPVIAPRLAPLAVPAASWHHAALLRPPIA